MYIKTVSEFRVGQECGPKAGSFRGLWSYVGWSDLDFGHRYW